MITVFVSVRLNHLTAQALTCRAVGLERNVEMTIPHDERPIDDPMWDNPEFDWNTGWVALDTQQATARGLPTSMHWPWDHSKGIYVLHGFHSMHCVVSNVFQSRSLPGAELTL